MTRLRNSRLSILGALALVSSCTSTLAPSINAAAATSTTSRSATGSHGMVVSASAIASDVGRNALAAGGNAVDAAVATAFALAVTYPTAGNIGGGGFMVIRMPDGRATTIDFRETAPAAASPTMFTDPSGAYSARIHHGSLVSVGVPGTVAGFALAHGKYGRADWKQLVDPAVRLAGDGFDLPTGLARSLAGASKYLGKYPASVAAYYRNGTPYGAGEHFRQPDLAASLTRIRDNGADGFYRGETARLLAAEMRRGGGLITEADLASYVAKERAPIRGRYRGYEIISMPPPSSGGVAIVEMLNILEGYDLTAAGHNSPQYVHLVTEAMRRAFLDRAKYMGDPDFTQAPIARLTDKAYAATLRSTMLKDRASTSAPAQVGETHESDQTTHFSIVDADGMAVSVTYTLENGYGLGAVVPGAGFLLNNEMGDFNGKPGLTDTTGLIGTDPNLARPGKRMLSSMSPTIIAKDGQLVAVVGSPGGRTIINTVLEVVLNLIDGHMGIQAAVNAPRFHHQWLPDVLMTERDAFPPATIAALEAMGYHLRAGGAQGTAHSIYVDAATGARVGAADPRDSDAGASGY
ncbi:MAG: gamma-glutamyltransferase [Gemmatimonadota bacterium]|nr:gamma-glutamyltransferase [Gemmatimonadota bacterium]